MSLLSDLSSELPPAGDARRLAIGRAAWEEALAAAGADPVAARARAWSMTPAGRRLLAAIFGNSPFLSGVAVREWGFLTHLVEVGGEPVVAEIIAALDARDDIAEDAAALMRRLRVAKRRVSLSVAVCDLAGSGRSNGRPRRSADSPRRRSVPRCAICCAELRRRARSRSPPPRIQSAIVGSSCSAWASSAAAS